MEVDLNKPLEQKNIVEKFTVEGSFKYGSAMIYLENKIKEQEQRILALEEAMMFFSDWYNKTQRANIILPENVDESGKTKIILDK